MSAEELQLAGNAALALLQLLLFGAGFAVYLRLVTRLQSDGGQVRTAGFDLADVFMSVFFAVAFGALAINLVSQRSDAPSPVKPDQVVQSGLFLLTILGGIAGFLHWRGLRLGELFGLRRVSLLRALGWSALLLVAALPFIAFVNLITHALLEGRAVQQPLVEFFREAATRADYPAMASVAVAAVLIAPLCEEFLFRGYFYGVGKRYLGPWITAPLTAVMFAAYHANLASLPGLAVLAVALTLAYERTGSLLVPIGMHALFNATSLAMLYAQGTGMLKP